MDWGQLSRLTERQQIRLLTQLTASEANQRVEPLVAEIILDYPLGCTIARPRPPRHKPSTVRPASRASSGLNASQSLRTVSPFFTHRSDEAIKSTSENGGLVRPAPLPSLPAHAPALEPHRPLAALVDGCVVLLALAGRSAGWAPRLRLLRPTTTPRRALPWTAASCPPFGGGGGGRRTGTRTSPRSRRQQPPRQAARSAGRLARRSSRGRSSGRTPCPQSRTAAARGPPPPPHARALPLPHFHTHHHAPHLSVRDDGPPLQSPDRRRRLASAGAARCSCTCGAPGPPRAGRPRPGRSRPAAAPPPSSAARPSPPGSPPLLPDLAKPAAAPVPPPPLLLLPRLLLHTLDEASRGTAH